VKKVCIITCYKQPDYIRARTLREATARIDGIDLRIVKNKNVGLLRYAEVIFKTILMRIKYSPDIYLVTFRGYEILPFIRLISTGKVLIFDEFINLIEWIDYEHKKIDTKRYPGKIIKSIYRNMLKSANLILSDTKSHAIISSKIMNINLKKYQPVIVSTDENVFYEGRAKNYSKELNIFYYGSMLPLHGMKYVLEAMLMLKNKNIKLTLIGGSNDTKNLIDQAIKKGASIKYRRWVDFEKLPEYISKSDICLAGPFGGTFQSQYVVTGKAYQFLSMGKPIIIGRNKESSLFNNKVNALLVDQANSESLYKVILWADSNRTKLNNIGKEGNKLYQEKLSNKILTSEMREVLGRF
jgi:glycosyltransferase involved in cell wall biosynthesis